MPRATALTIGNFDGVHVGHAALFARARELAGADGLVKVLAFFPHPMTRLAPHRAPAVLTPIEEKIRIIRGLGVDEVEVLAPEDAVLGLTPEAFVDVIAERHRPGWIVEGEDFHFGAKRAGNVHTLVELSKTRGFRVDVVPEVDVELADQSLVRASSTMARWLIAHGRVGEARRVLGRSYRFFGTVNPGAQRGRELGFRTANLQPSNMTAGEGVYAATALLPSGELRDAAVSVGTNPTFTGADDSIPVVVEAHILDWDGAGAPEYGYPLALDFHGWIREQRVYSETAALVEQIARDVELVRCVCRDAGERIFA